MRYSSAFLVIFIFISLSCAKSSNPVAPDLQRNLSAFYDAIEIFGPNTNEDFEPLFHDVALAQICTATPGYFAEYEEDHGCIAMALNRADNDPDTPFKPIFRWLDSDNYDTSETPIFYVCDRDDDDPDNSAEYRAIACDAIYNPITSTLYNIERESIEVVAAYMVRNRPGVLNDTEWDIEVTALRWEDDDADEFWTKEPTFRIPWTIPDGVAGSYDEFNPDIAYNFDTADVYLTFSDVPSDLDDDVYLMYRKYKRATNTLSSEYRAQSLDHNGYDPSIDVGYVTLLGSWQQWVAIGYTAQFDNHMGYHVNITAWPAGDNDDGNKFTNSRLRNPDHLYKDAGLPYVDIAPNSNMEHVGALIYSQVVDSDSYGVKTESYVVRFLGDVADLDSHILIESDDPGDPDFIDALYPSIAINKQDYMPSDIFASIAFMGQDTDVDLSDNWHPIVAKVRIYDYVPPLGQPEPLGTTWNGPADNGGNNNLIIGNYNLSDIPFQIPGVASAIVTNNNNRYWAAWNDRFEMEPPPTEVWASWGYAGN